jgi:NADH-quinone oxidoreductase subunit M
MAGEWIPLLLAAVPFAGAAAGFALWPRPQALKIWTLIVPLASLAVLCATIGREAGAGATGLFLHVLPVAAFFSLLGQPAHPDNRAAWLLTLVLLGVGFGALTGGGIGLMAQALFLVLVGLLLYRYWTVSGTVPWWGIGTCGVGAAGLLAAAFAAPPVSGIVRLAACAIFLPLMPLHGGYVAAFRGLPANLPAFLALALPVLGLHGLLALLPDLSGEQCRLLAMPALMGALYGTLKALVQSRVRLLAAYAGLSLFAVLWWYVAATRSAPPQVTVYLLAVGLVTSGFLLAWHAVQARYGEVDLRAIRGLAYQMPRFSTLLFLLTLAAIGLPPFGVYAGFMGMLLTPALPLSGGLVVAIGALLAACWYVLGLTQQLLFGRHREDLRYQDLSHAEAAALALIVVLLAVLGFVPPGVLDSGAPSPPVHVAELFPWKR